MKLVLWDGLKLKTKTKHFGKKKSDLIFQFLFKYSELWFGSPKTRNEKKTNKTKNWHQCPELLAEQCGLFPWVNIWEKDASQFWLDTLG